MALYIINKELSEAAGKIISTDKEAKALLIQDGVFANLSELPAVGIYALLSDVKKRGMEDILQGKVKFVSEEETVDLIVSEKVYNFA